MSTSDSDDDDDLFAGAPTFKRESRAAKAKQTRTFNYLDKMLKHTVENSEKRQKIESLMKESKDGPGDQSDVIFSLKKEEPDEHGTKECYDDNDDRYWEKVESMAQIANETKTKIMFIREASFSKPALTAPYLQKKINNCAATLGLKTKVMPSGAGHDSQQIAAIAPVGMIFVPSVGGVSHSPNEFTKASDMTNGANVLLQTILSIDRE